MDLVPTPDQVVTAAGNVVRLALQGGMADLRPMPRSVVRADDRHTVHHYDDAAEVAGRGGPVLLVMPPAVPSSCYDLRRGCSLVEHLVGTGRPTYVVEHAEVSFHDPGLGLEEWVQRTVPDAVRTVSRDADGRPVHVVGWGLGGIFALLAAADGPDLPIRSLAALGSPVDVAQVPMMAPLRPLFTAADLPPPVARAYRLLGGVPLPGVRWALELAPVQRLVTRPIAVTAHLDDADWLAQVEAVDRFTAATTAYRGRSFGQLYHRFAPGNALATGTVELGGRPVSLDTVTAPTLVVAGATDGIAPVAAVRAVLPLLTASTEVRFEIVPGGHLGLLTGRGARTTTWPALDDWFDQWDSAPAAEAIGTNRKRRHSSAGSRALSR